MKTNLDSQEIDKIVANASKIAAGDYKKAESTAKNHASLQKLQITINAELIKTIRHLDSKNQKLQKQIAWLTLIAAAATIVALLK